MDLNMVVLDGRLVTEPEHRVLDSGTRMARLLVAVRSEEPHSRLDVIPVIWWEPEDEFVTAPPDVGSRIWITGSVQRRFWDSADGRQSKLEVVAGHVSVYADDCQQPETAARSEP